MNVRDIVILVVCSALFIVLAVPLRHSLVDDTYIHLQYARNLSETGELSFNRGDPTYGSTSPLWVFLLALIHKLGGHLSVWCRALSWFFGLATVALVYRLTLFTSGRRSIAASAALIMASEAWLLRWSAVGMETSFAVFMVLVVLAMSFTSLISRTRSAVLGLMLFLAVLARPEALLMAPLVLFVFALTRERSIPCRLLWLIVFIASYAAWLLVIKSHTGTYLPLTAGAKQGRPVLSTLIFVRALVPVKIMGATLALPWISVIACIVIGAVRERSLFSFFLRSTDEGRSRSTDNVRSESDDGGAGEAVTGSAAGVNGGRMEEGRTGSTKETDLLRGGSIPPVYIRTGIFLALLWVVALPLVYVLFDFQILSRYLLPTAPAVVVLGLTGLAGVSARFTCNPSLRRGVLIVFTAFVIVQNIVFYFVVVVPPTRDFSRGMQDVLVGMGEWLDVNSDGDAVVAAPDIGAVGYISRRWILDLGGLVTPEINRMRRTIDVERIIEEGLYLDFEPDFLVDRSSVPARFAGKVIRDVRFEPIMQGTVSNLGIRKPDPVVYVLYRLERLEGIPAGDHRVKDEPEGED